MGAAKLKEDKMNSPPKQPPDREFFQRAGDVTYAYDLSGNFTFLSEEGERILGYSCAEACRMNIAELLDPEIAGQIREQIMRGAKQRIGAVYEIEIVAKDGRRVPVEVSTRVVLRDREPIEIQVVAVPSVIRGQLPTPLRARCPDERFIFGSTPAGLDIAGRVS